VLSVQLVRKVFKESKDLEVSLVLLVQTHMFQVLRVLLALVDRQVLQAQLELNLKFQVLQAQQVQ
jgi:hypothetical protein